METLADIRIRSTRLMMGLILVLLTKGVWTEPSFLSSEEYFPFVIEHVLTGNEIWIGMSVDKLVEEWGQPSSIEKIGTIGNKRDFNLVRVTYGLHGRKVEVSYYEGFQTVFQISTNFSGVQTLNGFSVGVTLETKIRSTLGEPKRVVKDGVTTYNQYWISAPRSNGLSTWFVQFTIEKGVLSEIFISET